MLHSISWYDFIRLVSIITIPYYLIVLFYFYQKEFAASFARQKILNKPFQGVKFDKSPESRVSPSPDDQDSFTTIHELLEDFKIIFKKAAETQMVKEELIQAIRLKLKEYPGIRENEIREDINDHIGMEAREKCNMDMAAEDLKLIWAV